MSYRADELKDHQDKIRNYTIKEHLCFACDEPIKNECCLTDMNAQIGWPEELKKLFPMVALYHINKSCEYANWNVIKKFYQGKMK